MEDSIFYIIALVFIVFLIFKIVARQYKRCPSDKVIVVYGNTGEENNRPKCIYGGSVFIIPLIQDYALLSLEPMTIDVDLRNALSKKNIRVNVSSSFTVAVSTNPQIMQNAAERLLGLREESVIEQAKDIIKSEMKLAITTLSIEEIEKNREDFSKMIKRTVNLALNKIGLELINLKITDIKVVTNEVLDRLSETVNETKNKVIE